MSNGDRASVDENPRLDDMDPQDLLMEATVRVLAEEGMDGLTLRKVADEAGKNRGLVHYYFESKDDLLVSLLDHILEGTTDLIGIEEVSDPGEKLRRVLRFHAYGPGGVDEAGRHYYKAILQLQALAVHHPRVRERLDRNHQFVVDLVAESIENGIAAEGLQDIDANELAVFLVTTIDGARNHDLATGGTASREIALDVIGTILPESTGEHTS